MSISVVNNPTFSSPERLLAREEVMKKNLFYVALSVVMLVATIFSAILAPWYVPVVFFALTLVPFIYWNNSKGELLTIAAPPPQNSIS